MSDADFVIHKDNSFPLFEATPKDINRAPLITVPPGTTAILRIWPFQSTNPTTVVELPLTIDLSAGYVKVTYAWSTKLAAEGKYNFRIRFTFPGGAIEDFPNSEEPLELHVTGPL